MYCMYIIQINMNQFSLFEFCIDFVYQHIVSRFNLIEYTHARTHAYTVNGVEPQTEYHRTMMMLMLLLLLLFEQQQNRKMNERSE